MDASSCSSASVSSADKISQDCLSNSNMLPNVAVYALAMVTLISFASYLIPNILLKFFGPQDLAKKYYASWAVVTGGSSGIGKAIVEKLAAQGVNVVIVAFPDKLFDPAMEGFKKSFPKLQFRGVPVDMSKPEFMKEVIKATEDIDVSLVFSNAGYIKTGFFADGPVEAQLANHHVNATAAVYISHHFVKQMQEKRLRGCICFTSSPASFMPCPFSALYGATKAWVTEFAMSLAAEVKSSGIDVCVVHPSPIASNFYEGTHSLDALIFFKNTASGPENIANALFSAVGRSVVRDHGYFPVVVRLLLKILDLNLLADIICLFAESTGDFKKMKNSNLAANIAPIKVKNSNGHNAHMG
jgi:short-subunit dehydrogenase